MVAVGAGGRVIGGGVVPVEEFTSGVLAVARGEGWAKRVLR